ncbi:MAG: PfkB family carbohydrate kinase, partial [Candidatus Omnitrophica bacterium]|nr:PfkB family carbohydrate kinase [Candidatus Omnitrophota bacterium]
YIDTFKRRKIDISGLTIAKGKTFFWEGRYELDFNNPKSISTCLNVFSNFSPFIPANYKNSKYVFLANISPHLQEKVLEQVSKPRLVTSDTMSYWIDNEKEALERLLKKVDIFFLNEIEAKKLTEENNLVKAANKILKFGPQKIVIKRGEYGAILFSSNSKFYIPAFLLDNVVDPTGAGDTFAGGFMGYLASKNRLNESIFKESLIYGTIMASFTVEDFSLNRLLSIKKADISKRIKEFKKLTSI